jgi:hypothetical protein
MEGAAIKTRPRELGTHSSKNAEAYHSVEVTLKELSANYQFKLRCMGSSPMCFLVKENSRILRRVKVGDTLRMKYYSSDSVYHVEYLNTQIKDITKKDQGRFKGHCLVELQILEDQE